MSEILLTDEQIGEAIDYKWTNILGSHRQVAQAQLRQVVEWLEERNSSLPSRGILFIWSGDWQALRRAVGKER